MEPIVLFDGVCNFCNSAVNFIIERDKKGVFKFAPLQSEVGRELAAKYQVASDVDSVILVENGQAYIHSDAALKIAAHLGGLWGLAGIFRIVPKVLRDKLYTLFAERRYRWFGKKDACMVPTPEVRERFLA